MSVMLDWLSFVVSYDGPDICGGRTLIIDENGEQKWEKLNFKSVEGSYSGVIQVKTVPYRSSGNGLYISGNPTKFLQGHNLFGCFDLVGLATDLVKIVMDKLCFYDLVIMKKVSEGRFDLKRIDITSSFRLPSTVDVRAWLKHATVYASGKLQGASDFRGKTLYFGKHSRFVSMKFYCKFDDKYFQKDITAFDDDKQKFLKTFSEGLLRAELTFRSMKLKKICLDQGFHWNERIAQGFFNMHIQKINLTGEYDLNRDEVDNLPTRYRAAYELYKQGKLLSELYSRATYYRYKKFFLEELDINVDIPRLPDRGNVVPLIKVLRAEPVSLPQEAFDLGLIHTPTKRSI